MIMGITIIKNEKTKIVLYDRQWLTSELGGASADRAIWNITIWIIGIYNFSFNIKFETSKTRNSTQFFLNFC